MTMLQKEKLKWDNKLVVYKSAMEVLWSNVKLTVNYFTDIKENNGSKSIQKIKKRIKKLDSILGKLKKKGVNFTVDEIDNNIHDIIGIRIVCLTMTDVKEMIDLLCEQLHETPNITITEQKDYINNPKDSGYRAYHIQLKFKLRFGKQDYEVNAEIQVKTVIMDAWAELEHRLRYKYNSLDNLPEELKEDFEMLKTQFNILAQSGEFTDNLIAKFILGIEKLKVGKKVKQQLDISKTLLSEWEERQPIYQKAEDVLDSELRIIYENNKEIMNEDGYSWVQKYIHRPKSLESSVLKLKKKGKEININNIEKSVSDLIGYRIVCLTQNDLYECFDLIIASLSKNPNVSIVGIKNYIEHPKASGYRGIHIQLKYKVVYGGITYELPAEIQFRTAVMDAWSELEQKFKYKEEYSSRLDLSKDLVQLLNSVKDQLYTLALTSSSLDDRACDFINKTKEIKKKTKQKKSS